MLWHFVLELLMVMVVEVMVVEILVVEFMVVAVWRRSGKSCRTLLA